MASASSTGIRAKTMDHITIVVSDVERSIKFYTQVLGMQRVERPAFGFPGAWFRAGQTFLHLNVASPEAGRAGFGDLGAAEVSRGFHYAFAVDDCDAAADQLDRQGIEIVTGPRSRPDGARQLYIYDPDGHLIELCSG